MAIIENITEAINRQPVHIKVGILIVIIAIMCGLYWHFFWSPKTEELKQAQIQLQKEEAKLNEYEAIAKEFPKFEQEFNKLNKELELAIRKLPEKKEIPSLIDSIYAAVSASGLESDTFAPKGEVRQQLYAEIPIDMKVFGSYYELANFFSSVSRLPRIVNIRDLNLDREEQRGRGKGRSTGGENTLSATFTAVTFRLLPPESQQPETKGKKAKPKQQKPEEG